MPALLERIETLLTAGREIVDLHLPVTDGEELAWLYRSTEVLSRDEHDGIMNLRVRVPEKALGRFRQRFAGQIATVK